MNGMNNTNTCETKSIIKPLKFRFVTCSTNCYNDFFSKKFFGYLKIVLDKIKRFESHFFIYNNRYILNFIKNNNIDFVHTFDFENLFTGIPHDNLISICSEIFEVYFKYSNLTKLELIFLKIIFIMVYILIGRLR